MLSTEKCMKPRVEMKQFSDNDLFVMVENEEKQFPANYELSRRIVDNNPLAVNYYLTNTCSSIISNASATFARREGSDSILMSDVYLVLSSPMGDDKKPKWEVVAKYDPFDVEKTPASLKTYTNTIIVNHFRKKCRDAARIDRQGHSKQDSDVGVNRYNVFMDYQTLLLVIGGEAESGNSTHRYDESQRELCREAFLSLKERDQDLLYMLFYENKSGLEVYDELEDRIDHKDIELDPALSDEQREKIIRKKRQDAVSVEKSHVLERLSRKYYIKCIVRWLEERIGDDVEVGNSKCSELVEVAFRQLKKWERELLKQIVVENLSYEKIYRLLRGYMIPYVQGALGQTIDELGGALSVDCQRKLVAFCLGNIVKNVKRFVKK